MDRVASTIPAGLVSLLFEYIVYSPQNHQNLNSPKATIVNAVREIPLAMIRKSIDDWPKYLQCCMQAKGDSHFV